MGTVLVLAAIGAASATELVSGLGDAVVHSVPEGTNDVQTDGLFTGPDAAIYKLGDGVWTLPDAVLSGHHLPLGIRVLEGSLALGDAETPAPAATCPTVMNTARFWFDASKRDSMTVRSEDGKDFVDAWYDVRETTPQTPHYVFCQAMHDCKSEATQQPGLSPELAQVDGVDAIWFGGLASGRYLLHHNPDGSLELPDANAMRIKAVFAVHAVKTSFGFLFGNRHPSAGQTTHAAFPIQSYGNATAWGNYLADWEIANYAYETYNARTFLDGRPIDPTTTKPLEGLQLYEVDFGRGAESIQTFFNDNNHNSDAIYVEYRQGGDYLCEAVAFTNTLTEAERLQVESYLMRKWMPGKLTAEANIQLGSGTSATINTYDQDIHTKVKAGGVGALEILGRGSVTFEDSAVVDTDDMRVRPVADGGRIVSAKPLPLALRGGEVATIESYYFNRGGNADQGTTEIRTSVTSGAANDAIVKRGSETLVLDTVPQDVRLLKVEQGDLYLRAHAKDLEGSAEDFIAIPNASFEDSMNGADNSGEQRGKSFAGWSFSWETGPCNAWVFKSGGSYASNGWNLQGIAPDGDYALFLKGNVTASTEVVIPKPGVYEFSAAIGGRHDQCYSCGYALDVNFVGAGTTVFAGRLMAVVDSTIGRWVDAHYHRRILRVRFDAAGTYALKLAHAKTYPTDDWINDRECCVDDLHLRRLPESDPDNGVWPLPNGDFERAVFAPNPSAAPYASEAMFSSDNTVAGWTLKNSNAAFTTRCVARYANGTGGCIDYNDSRYPAGGEVELCFHPNGQVETTFTPPAGSWQLRANLARVQSGGLTLSAKVAIGDAETALSDGPVRPESIRFTSFTWPKVFTVDGETPVKLTLESSASGDNVFADDFCLVPSGGTAGEGPELVSNGDFEMNRGWPYNWTPTNPTRGWATGDTPKAASDLSEHWGYGAPHGNNYLFICEDASVTSLPMDLTPGIYRFSMLARTRHDVWGKSWGFNPIVAELTDGTTTQAIARVVAKGTNFVEYAWNFRVEDSGTRNLVLRGGFEGTVEGRTTLVDMVSIRKIQDQPTYPDVPETLWLEIAEGSKLHLDFTGTQTVDHVKIGRQVYTGVIDAALLPEVLSGPGALFVKTHSTLLLFR